MAKRRRRKVSKDYFGIGYVVSVILAIIPVTSLILGIVTRLSEGKIVAAIVLLVFGWNVIWIADIVPMIVNGRILRLLAL